MRYTQSFPIEFDPLANPEAVIRGPQVRFSVLTSRLLRLEYSSMEEFEDRPSQAFWYRRQSAPEFSLTQSDDCIEIETEYLHLHYTITADGFSSATLNITLKGSGETWHYGQSNPLNLLGTARTLDEIDGALGLEEGLISRGGWSVYNDSTSLVFDESGWLKPRKAAPDVLDLYFFGYTKDYAACQREFRKIAGPGPILPRWALGNWWSRYWRYSADGLLALMDDFRTHEVPLSVCIVDMDWHITDTGNTSSGWTGYTWNRDLFPNPPAFLQSLKQRGLKTALNLHPAEGVHPHEEGYPAMAERLGIDPDTEAPIPFDIADPEFTRAYFEVLHHPLEEMGVDFWWTDWQQGMLSGLPGLDPLWWLNHLHFYDLARDGKRRPFIFSRWGGLGNHRYQIGFSGDTHVTWDSLAFQPYFTATASNVGYGWWSHDIGGHMGGIEEPELFTRWVQYGVFSPILRLHSTNAAFHERRPWGYDAETERLARKAMQLRHALIPYLYTMAYRDHTLGESLARPMYYQYPDQEPAYHCPDQYTFGSELIAAPFISPASRETRLSRQVVWLPQGGWFEFFSGERYPGGGWQAIYGALEDIPVFAKSGAIVPLGPMSGWGGVDNPQALDLHLFPGENNTFELYEDDGLESNSLTPIHQQWTDQAWACEIQPVVGEKGHLPSNRTYTLRFRGVQSEVTIAAYRDGKPIAAASSYEATTTTLVVGPIEQGPSNGLKVSLTTQAPTLLADSSYHLSQCKKIVSAIPLDTWIKGRLYNHLPEIVADPKRLVPYELHLAPEQIRALVEVLTGAGLSRYQMRRAPTEATLLWNNESSDYLKYKFSVLDLSGRAVRREGILPRFVVLAEEDKYLKLYEIDQQKRRFNNAGDWFEALPRRFQMPALAGRSAVVQFRVTGEGGTASHLKIRSGLARRANGEHPQPHAVLTITAQDFLTLVNGEASPFELSAQGKLQISGDIELLFAVYQSLEILPQDVFRAERWRLEVDYMGMLKL